MITYLVQSQEIPVSSVNELLGWVVGVLIVFIGAMFLYFKTEISAYKRDLQSEREYSRTQDQENVKTLIHVNNILQQLTKQLEKNTDNLADIRVITESIKPVLEKNQERLEDINNHLLRNGKRDS